MLSEVTVPRDGAREAAAEYRATAKRTTSDRDDSAPASRRPRTPSPHRRRHLRRRGRLGPDGDRAARARGQAPVSARRTRGRLRRLNATDRAKRTKRNAARGRVVSPTYREAVKLRQGARIAKLQVQLDEAIRDRDERAQRATKALLALKVRRLRRQLAKAEVAA